MYKGGEKKGGKKMQALHTYLGSGGPTKKNTLRYGGGS
jgi:hypothetical protein